MAFLACGGASDSVHRQCGGHSCLATETGTMAFQNNVLLLPKELDEKVTNNALICTRCRAHCPRVVQLAPQERVEQQCCTDVSQQTRLSQLSSDSYSSHEGHMLQDVCRSSSLYESSGPSVELQRRGRAPLPRFRRSVFSSARRTESLTGSACRLVRSDAGTCPLVQNQERVSERVVEQIVDLAVPQTCECRPCPPSCTALPTVFC